MVHSTKRKSKKQRMREAEAKRQHARDVLLHALTHFYARWEWVGDGPEDLGEVCVNGLRYACRMDEDDLPILDDHLARVLEKARGEYA